MAAKSRKPAKAGRRTLIVNIVGGSKKSVSCSNDTTYQQVADKLGMTKYVFVDPKTGESLEMEATVALKAVTAMPNVKDGSNS